MRANTSNQQISRLEKSQRKLTVEWLYRIARALDVTPLDVLGEPPPLTTREEAVLELFRGLNPEQQDAFLKAADAMAKLIPARKAGNGD